PLGGLPLVRSALK
ncbi:hypothetical protein A2U01_0114945, partial [Trifolium medium]|nr:hypothetical protein [Trifolium medium]